jgi:NADPH:quinone reductase-like Zn-dependent oxidoreductase
MVLAAFASCFGTHKTEETNTGLRSVLTSKFTDKKAIFIFAGEKEEELLALKEMIEEGKIKSIVDNSYLFEQAAEAHRKVETEQRLGIVVISIE